MGNVKYIDNSIDANEHSKDDNAKRVLTLGSFVPEAFDYVGLTYVAAGNGAGEIETVTYKTGGSGGSTVAILTLGYNADNKLETVTRS